MKPQEINLNHEALAQFRLYMDDAIQAVSRTMMKRGLKSGTVTGKVEIEIRAMTSKDGEIIKMMVLKPDVKLKIGSNENFKCDKVGAMYAQVDDKGNVIAGDNQISMEEYMNDQRGA